MFNTQLFVIWQTASIILKPVYATMVAEKFQIQVVKITGKYICESKKIESVHFYSCPQAKLSPWFLLSPLQQKEFIHFARATFYKNLCFPSRKGVGLWS